MASILINLIEQDQKLEGSGKWLHGTVNSSLVVDVEKDYFYWNSVGISGNAFIWLTKVKGLSIQQAKEYLLQQPDFQDTFIHTIKNTEEIITYPKIVDVMFERGQNTNNDYWKRRGLTDETISRFRLGYLDTPDGLGFWTIPIYQDGIFRQVQLRRDIPTKVIKKYYRNTLDPSYLFNSDILNLVSSIIITESPVSAMRIQQEGLPAISWDGGSGYWSDSWFSKFLYCKKIWICLDNDNAGNSGAKKIAKSLGEFRCKIYNFWDFDPKFGADNLLNSGYNIEGLKELLETKSKYVFEL
jgi:hypothetical protein